MRTRISLYPLLLVAGLHLPLPSLAAGEGHAAEEASFTQSAVSPWPMKFSQDGAAYIVYPPRFESWENDVLRGRAAVSVQLEGAEQPNYGTVQLSARTRDASGDRLDISGLVVQEADFPAARDREEEHLRVLRERLAQKSWQAAAETLRNDLTIERTARQVRNQPLRDNPPRILFSQQPAVLVPVDGEPVMRELDQTSLLRVVNTRALLLFDRTAGRYYLSVAGHWMTARSLEGPWTETREIAEGVERARRIAVEQGKVDLLEGDSEAASAEAPAIHVSTKPTELLQTEGPIEYSPVPDTQLLYVSNSPDRIFFDMRSQRFLVLLSGRWYRAAELSRGNWEHVPGNELPEDFARIPDDHPMAAVRSAVPNTPQAEEAVIANGVPQVATIRRDAARIELTYDGEPEFKPIEGTSLHYAVNAPVPVIRVDADDYYALDNGVWFTARSPYGPWSAASQVPAAIYAIPRSSPLHYVTHVRVYGETADTVDYGYTPGYLGSYVSNSVVVYGSGWHYQPWIGHYWYGSPWTWGHGFSFHYSWWYPWPYHYHYSYYDYHPYYWRPCYRPWWGPWAAPVHRTPVRAAPRPHPIRGTIAEQYGSNPIALSGGGVYSRWGREIARQVAPPAPPASVTNAAVRSERLRPGTGYIIRDGRRHYLSDRNISDRGRDVTVVPDRPARHALPDGAAGRNAGRVFDRGPRQAETARGRAIVEDRAPQVTPHGPIGRTAGQVMRARPDPVSQARRDDVRPGRAEVRALPQRREAPVVTAPPVVRNEGAMGRAMRSVMPTAPRLEQRQAIPERRAMPRPQIERAIARPQIEPRAMPRPAPPPRAMQQQRPPQPRAQQAQPSAGGGAVQRGLGRAFGER